MLKITVELWPFGSKENKKEIASFDIGNNGTGTREEGNYDVRYEDGKWVEDVVQNYPRKSTDVLRLVYLVLKKKYG